MITVIKAETSMWASVPIVCSYTVYT